MAGQGRTVDRPGAARTLVRIYHCLARVDLTPPEPRMSSSSARVLGPFPGLMAILTVMDVFEPEPPRESAARTDLADPTDLWAPSAGEAGIGDLEAMSPPVRTMVLNHLKTPRATGLLPCLQGGGRVCCSLFCEHGAGTDGPRAWELFLPSGPTSGLSRAKAI